MDQSLALAELAQKLDALNAQVAYLTEQARADERQRQDRAELMRDLTPIADQAFDMAVGQLEEVQEYIDLGDVLRLLKRLLRNGRNLDKMLDQLESLMDLAATVGPLADDAFGTAVDKLTEMEHKGYFAFARGGLRIADNIVTSFTEADLQQLGDNIVPMVKELTRPEIMSFARNTLLAVEREVEQPVDTSMLGLLRQMRDPDVRRGLALSMRMLRVIGAQAK